MYQELVAFLQRQEDRGANHNGRYNGNTISPMRLAAIEETTINERTQQDDGAIVPVDAGRLELRQEEAQQQQHQEPDHACVIHQHTSIECASIEARSGSLAAFGDIQVAYRIHRCTRA